MSSPALMYSMVVHFFFMTWFLLLYFLVFSFVYVSPSVPCASQVIQPRPSIQPLVRAKHSATRPGQASDRLSRPSIPLARGIRLLVAAQHSTVCHGKASRKAFSHPSGLSNRPFVTAKHSAVCRGQASRLHKAFSHSSGLSIRPFVAAKHPARTRHSATRLG